MKKPKKNPEFKKYKYSAAAVDLVALTIIDNEINVLLVENKYKPFKGKLALPGGRIRTYESIDECAKRELYENTKIKNAYLEQLYSFGNVKRDPSVRIISIAHLALLSNPHNVELNPNEKYDKIFWMPINKAPRLSYDHNEILKYAINRLKAKLTYTNIVYNLLPQKFSLSEMRKVYETILEKEIDKRNFRKKIFSLGLLKETGVMTGVPYRPSKLYSFKNKALTVVEIF